MDYPIRTEWTLNVSTSGNAGFKSPRVPKGSGRKSGTFTSYKANIAQVFADLIADEMALLEHAMESVYPWLVEPWQQRNDSAYPHFAASVWSDDPLLAVFEEDCRPHIPPYIGPSPKHPDRAQTRLWRWVQRHNGNDSYDPAWAVSAFNVARKIAREGTTGKHELQRIWITYQDRWTWNLGHWLTERLERGN